MSEASRFIPLSAPHLAGKEWEYVKQCLDTGWVSTAGSFVTRFEGELAATVGARHAVACASGTAALHVALQIVGVRSGDLVIAPSLTFVAPINAVRYLGADPIFFGCDAYFDLDAVAVDHFLETEVEARDEGAIHRETGRRIAALVSVHVFGNAGDWWDLYDRARSLGIAIVDDATEALGTRYESGPWAGAHAGVRADLGCYSFNGNKILTTGGGGMIVTDDEGFAARARYLSQQAKDDSAIYRHDEVGYNYRLTNLAAAVGTAQLEQLEDFVTAKRRHHSAYAERLASSERFRLRPAPDCARNNLWLNAVEILDPVWRGRGAMLAAELRNRGIEARPIWLPNHWQKPYVNCPRRDVASAETAVANVINVPSSVQLTVDEIDRVCDELSRV